MSRNSNQSYGKRIAEAVLASLDDSEAKEPTTRSRSWLADWFEPAPMRDRSRRWLSAGLKSSTRDIPPNLLACYLLDAAEDVRQLGSDEAITRLVNKMLPELVSEEGAVRGETSGR